MTYTGLRSVVVAGIGVATVGSAAVTSVHAADLDQALVGPAGMAQIAVLNDVVGNTDRDYTSGLRGSFTTAPGHAPGWLQGTAGALPGPSAESWAVFAVGQDIFTPRNIRRSDPDPDDRPYAGFLYGSATLVRQAGTTLDQIGLTLGVVGPAALAEQVQNGVHTVLNDPRASGFDHQLRNEPIVQLGYRRGWQVLMASAGPFAVDVTPDAEVAVGNLYDYVGAGGTLRIGSGLRPDNGPAQADPALPGSGESIRSLDDRWFYVFAGVHGRAVARNLVIEGNSFQDSPGVDHRVLVGDISGGAAASFGRARLAYTQVLRSPEFHGGRVDTFGMVTASLAW